MSAPTLTCAETFRRLDDYLDRELSPDETVQVATHLKTCEICAEEFAVEREVWEGIRGKLLRLRVPHGLREKISSLLDRA